MSAPKPDKDVKPDNVMTTYHEMKMGKTLYCITSEYKGETDLGKTLEDIIIQRIINESNTITEDEDE
jgi:hypothetical protein